MSPLLMQTLGALGTCRTEVDFYKVAIDLRKHATPTDMVELADVGGQWSHEFKEWVASVRADLPRISPIVQGFRLERLGDTLSLYRGSAPALTIVLAFCGQADLLFIPTATVLQHFSAERHAVLLLRDPARIGFIGGMAGHSTSFAEMVARLPDDAGLANYREIRTFGVSGGGAAAIAAGGVFSATSAVAFSGHLPSASMRYGTAPAAAAFETMLRGVAPRVRGACVFSADHIIDVRNASALAAAANLRLVAVPHTSQHNVLFELYKRDELAPLLHSLGLTT